MFQQVALPLFIYIASLLPSQLHICKLNCYCCRPPSKTLILIVTYIDLFASLVEIDHETTLLHSPPPHSTNLPEAVQLPLSFSFVVVPQPSRQLQGLNQGRVSNA
jgi:hypothetical protein